MLLFCLIYLIITIKSLFYGHIEMVKNWMWPIKFTWKDKKKKKKKLFTPRFELVLVNPSTTTQVVKFFDPPSKGIFSSFLKLFLFYMQMHVSCSCHCNWYLWPILSGIVALWKGCRRMYEWMCLCLLLIKLVQILFFENVMFGYLKQCFSSSATYQNVLGVSLI